MVTTYPSFGHYEVLGAIGAGGMGEVYVARDPKLGRKVAIKILPQRLTGERDTLTRFTQEARSASALNHPNIVTIHEVGAADGSPFIVMEYIEGDDLRTLIHRGPVPVRQALEIAAQIADGLAAAHERGIIHRDLKPENIMVTRDGFVKILDFGLAKVITPAGEVTENTLELELPGTTPGTILGTVGYMSPEQATGRRLDFRSDQFAFGAILHELVTGKPAFDGETAIDTLSAILHHEPPAVTKANPRVPVQLADVVRRLLAKSAEERYASPRDLARELRMLRDRVVADESGFHRPVTPKRGPLLAVVAAVALAAFIGGVAFLSRDRNSATAAAPAASAPAAKKYLAILGFKAGDPNGQLVADGFTETLTARLSRFPAVQVMRPPAASPAPADVRQAARELGANLVLTGLMQRAGEAIRVTYSVVDANTGQQWTGLVDGTTSDLFAVQDEVAEKVASNLDLGTSPVRLALDPAVSQKRYLEALGHLRRYDRIDSVDSAIAILRDLGASPTVHAALARGYLAKYQLTRDPRFAEEANDAAEKALAQDPQSIDVNITLGELRRRTGRYPDAVAAFLRVLSQQPTNADAVLGLAGTYRAAGDFKNAEATYKRVIELQPKYWAGYNHLGTLYFVQGRYPDAVAQFEVVVRLVPDSVWGYNNLGAALQRQGRYDEALTYFSRSIDLAPSGQAYSNVGTCYYFMGRYAEAAAAFEQAVELTPHALLYWRNLGDAYRWIPGQERNARRAYERAVELSDDEIRVNAGSAAAYASRASALAKLGRTGEARVSILRALELEPRDAGHIYEAAVVANLSGAPDEALARIEQAIRLGYNRGDIARDPEFENLKRNGRLHGVIRTLPSTTT